MIDAVPEGGLVRFVLSQPPEDTSGLAKLIGAGKITAAPPRFEDGFMVLLRAHTAERNVADRRGAGACDPQKHFLREVLCGFRLAHDAPQIPEDTGSMLREEDVGVRHACGSTDE